MGNRKQMAMTIYGGWDSIGLLHSSGTNPESSNSIAVYATATKRKQYGGKESYILISQVITKDEEESFNKDEIFPIASIQYTDTAACGTYGPVTITMKDGTSKKIDYEAIEGQITL